MRSKFTAPRYFTLERKQALSSSFQRVKGALTSIPNLMPLNRKVTKELEMSCTYSFAVLPVELANFTIAAPP